jgi:hypothetical protein
MAAAERRRPTVETIGWLLLALAYPALALVKIDAVDQVPWHLATARLAEQLGHWPVRNAFSHTFPDYPLYQQYPVFQAAIYAVYKLGGWTALTVAMAVGWAGAVLLFVRWAGARPSGWPLHLPWAVAVLSLQTRMVLRPDLLSLLLLPAMLLSLDAYRGGRRAAIAGVPLLHWLWINGHQLFVVSFGVQLLFLGHLVLSRWRRFGVDGRDAGVPIAPVIAALLASVLASFLTPLGARIVAVPAQSAGSAVLFREHVQELARIWSDPVWTALFLALALPSAIALARTWRAWRPFEVGLWLLTCAIALNAIRGLVYFTLIAPALLQRALLQRPAALSLTPLLRGYLRVVAVALTGAIAIAIVYHRWGRGGHAHAGDTEVGLGRSTSGWLDAPLAALRADPPPGRMMNVPYEVANALMWSWPEQPVFVDPRFEAYPRRFLLDCIASYDDDAAMQRLIDAHRPSWILGTHCTGRQGERLLRLARSGQWAPTYADSETVVLVRVSPETAAYRARHPFTPPASPADLLSDGRRTGQRLCYARVLDGLGYTDQAAAQRAAAAAERTDHR